MYHIDLSQPVVRGIKTAVAQRHRRAIQDLLAPDAALTDDGESFAPMAWIDREVFDADGRLQIAAERDGGLTLLGRFLSREWNLGTEWRFTLAGDRVARLDVRAA